MANSPTINSSLINKGIEILNKNKKFDSAVTTSVYNMWSPLRARKLDKNEVEIMWKAVQQNMGKFQQYFGRQNFILVDNNSPSQDVLNDLYVQMEKIVKEPVTHRAAVAWMRDQLPS